MESGDAPLGLESRQRAAAAGGCVAVFLRLQGRMLRSSGRWKAVPRFKDVSSELSGDVVPVSGLGQMSCYQSSCGNLCMGQTMAYDWFGTGCELGYCHIDWYSNGLAHGGEADFFLSSLQRPNRA